MADKVNTNLFVPYMAHEERRQGVGRGYQQLTIGYRTLIDVSRARGLNHCIHPFILHFNVLLNEIL